MADPLVISRIAYRLYQERKSRAIPGTAAKDWENASRIYDIGIDLCRSYFDESQATNQTVILLLALFLKGVLATPAPDPES